VVAAVGADPDVGQVERVKDQLDLGSDQQRVDLIAVAVQPDDRGLGHGAVLRPSKRLGQVGRRRNRERAPGQPPGERRLPGLGVHPAVVDGLDPGGEQPVQLRQIGDPAAGCPVGCGDLHYELVVDIAEEAFDLPAALGLTG
jgi:hypothetical protein